MLKQFGHKRDGASLLGYGLVVGLISVVALSAVTSSGSQIQSLFGTVAGELQGAGGSAGGGQAGSGGSEVDAPPSQVALSGATGSVSEDAVPGPNGHLVAGLVVTDDGVSPVSFSVDDTVNFQIVGSELYLNPPGGLDFEAASSFPFTVTATDGAGSAQVGGSVAVTDNGTFSQISSSSFNFAGCTQQRVLSGANSNSSANLSGSTSGVTGSTSLNFQGVVGFKCPLIIDAAADRVTFDWAGGTTSYSNTAGSGGGSCFQIYAGDPDPLTAGHNVINWSPNCSTSGGPLFNTFFNKSSGSSSLSVPSQSHEQDVTSLGDNYTIYLSFGDAWAGGVSLSMNFGTLTITEEQAD
ncbi:MAG: hypothetical protein Alpg2KO_07030 [Alphaproteobacteria bacterium]